MYLPINNITHSRVNGPGNRLVIWVQGCSFHCKGCFNPETHPYSKDRMMDVKELAKLINEDTNIEGITLSGGEPLDYPTEIYAFLKLIDNRLTSIIYSGYELEEIQSNKSLLKILKLADLSIVGRYNNKLPHPFLGKKFVLSSNRIDINYFKPKHIIEYTTDGRSITKTGIFRVDNQIKNYKNYEQS